MGLKVAQSTLCSEASVMLTGLTSYANAVITKTAYIRPNKEDNALLAVLSSSDASMRLHKESSERRLLCCTWDSCEIQSLQLRRLLKVCSAGGGGVRWT